MMIRDLFSKDISRSINGVVKADQIDDASTWQELEEYVVTKELDQHIRRFFGAYLDAIDHARDSDVTGKIGVWVSGFFGSGKSHFIKILSYLLENRTVTFNGETRRALDFFDDRIQDRILYADIKRAVSVNTDVILFNIDSKADPRDGRGAILSVFLRVFNQKLGYSGDHPHIAKMERYLQTQGKLEAFHTAYKAACGKEWVDERDAYEFNRDEVIDALAQTLEQTRESALEWLQNAEKNLVLTPENFAKWVKEYLDIKGPDHRIVFLADEIGQYIGSNTDLMLSLQTITENLGVICGGRAWVVVTSQEDIETVVGEVNASKANDFSKIQGRFKTRISLSSANTDEVIQKRLLSKKPEAEKELNAVFAAKGDILKNQLSFTNAGMTFKGIDGETSFIVNYPFVPYQFQLVQKVFEDIRKHGAVGIHLSRGERSMLDAFQLAAQLIADKPVGALVPLYRFYPSIESFLETTVKRTIDQAKERGLDDFDIEVLRVLFLVRYIEEFKSNVNNLVTLCIDQIDTDRLALRHRIEESLQRLEKETLINRNGENYFFLTNEERDITREIKDVEISGSDESRKLGELIFKDVLSDNNKHRYSGNKKDFGFNRFCDGFPVNPILSSNDLVVSIISPLADDYKSYDDSKCVMDSMNDGGKLLIKLGNNDQFVRDLRMYLKTDKYIRQNNDDALPPTTKRILKEHQEENRQLDARLLKIVEEMLCEAEYYVAGQTRIVQSSSAIILINDLLTYLIDNTFPKLGYLKSLKPSEEACRQETQSVLRANDVGQQSLEIQADDANSQAYEELRRYIDLSNKSNRQVVLHELLERFGRRPFGWPDYETVLLLARLLVVGEISIVMDGDTIPASKAFEPLTKPAKWRSVTVLKRKTVDTAILQKARKLGLEIFAETGPDTEEGLFNFLREKLTTWKESLRVYSIQADTDSYPGKDDIQSILNQISALLKENSSYTFIERFLDSNHDLKDMAEIYHELSHFYTHQKPVWDRLLAAIREFNPNRPMLEKDVEAAAALKRMDAIQKAPAPYNLIKDIDSLIQTVRTVNTDLLTRRRTSVLEKVSSLIAEVERELTRTESSDDLSHKCLSPLQLLKANIEKEAILGNIQQFETEAIEMADRAINIIEQEQLKANERNEQLIRETSKEPDVPIKPSKPIQYVKQIRIVKPIDHMKKSFIETDEDVDEFVDALRAELHAAIAENARVRIR